MSSKLFASIGLISLGLVLVGCNANLSTGHPNQKPVTAAQKPVATTPTTTVSPKPSSSSTGSASALDSDFAGLFSCTATTNEDTCLPNETIKIDEAVQNLTFEWTGPLGSDSGPTCDILMIAVLGASTTANDGTVTASITFKPQALGKASIDDSKCTATLGTMKQADSTASITLLLTKDSSGNDELVYTKGTDLKISLLRLNPTPNPSASPSVDPSPSPSTTPPANEAEAAAQLAASLNLGK